MLHVDQLILGLFKISLGNLDASTVLLHGFDAFGRRVSLLVALFVLLLHHFVYLNSLLFLGCCVGVIFDGADIRVVLQQLRAWNVVIDGLHVSSSGVDACVLLLVVTILVRSLIRADDLLKHYLLALERLLAPKSLSFLALVCIQLSSPSL